MRSQMNRVKTDFGNRLSREHLDHYLRISEEVPDISTLP